MARPVIALTTDFGLADHYVGSMKGVIAGVCPDAALIDITQQVPAHDILAGALALEAAAPAFPAGAVFLAVVDPGVGTSRRGIAARIGPWTFVGPDNGLATLLWRAHGTGEIVELVDRRFRRPSVSRTFEGRDRFAPAAGWIACGTALGSFGPAVEAPVLLDVPDAEAGPDGVRGEVVSVDHFGTLVTSIRRAHLDAASADGSFVVDVGGRAIGPVRGTYSDVPTGVPCAILGSSERLEIACNGGRARDVLQLDRGASVRLRRAV